MLYPIHRCLPEKFGMLRMFILLSLITSVNAYLDRVNSEASLLAV